MKPVVEIYNWIDHNAIQYEGKRLLHLPMIYSASTLLHHSSGKHSMLHVFSAMLKLVPIPAAVLDSESASFLDYLGKKLLNFSNGYAQLNCEMCKLKHETNFYLILICWM